MAAKSHRASQQRLCSQHHLLLLTLTYNHLLSLWNTHAQKALEACFDRPYVPPVLHHLQLSPKFVVSSLFVFSACIHPFPGGKQHLSTKNLATCIFATWGRLFLFFWGRRAELSITNKQTNNPVSEQCAGKLRSSSKPYVTDKSRRGFPLTTWKTPESPDVPLGCWGLGDDWWVNQTHSHPARQHTPYIHNTIAVIGQ